MEIVIASTNMHEIRELRAMLKSMRVFDIYSLHDFPTYTLPKQLGSTLQEIGCDRAIDASQAIGMVAISSYSGLIVPSLQGNPGIQSATYAGPAATDKENRNKLLVEMQNLQDTDRSAYLECWLAIASPSGLKKSVQGVSEGVILSEERGNHGYGYDSLFLKHDYSKTLGELEEETKNRISHIRKAFDKLQLSLNTLVEDALLYRRV